ncbi:MAG: chemotaxis protein CheD [Acidobacteriota bacterium]
MKPPSLLAGEMKVSSAPGQLIIHGLGSCVAVFLYDSGSRVGGLAHILLPSPPPDATDRLGRYAPTAIATMIEESLRLGAQREALRAKVTGGSRMFAIEIEGERPTIGEKNVAAALTALKTEGIEVIAADTGGDRGRTVAADLEDGSLTISTIRGEPQVL